MRPIDILRSQYTLIAQTADSSLRRLKLKRVKVDEEMLVLQATYLFGVRSFEFFLESQLIHLCDPAVTWGPKSVGGLSRRFVRKLSDPNRSRIKELLTLGSPSQYATYLPYEHTLKKANVLFARGRPFSLLELNLKDGLERARLTRNLIAHDSEAAFNQFQRRVLSRYPLPPTKRNIDGYLLHEAIRGTPMIKSDLADLLKAAQFLS